jgi:3-oxoacyl-[acyl-carrier protein] reductase
LQRLKGKAAIVTGASKGIGRAIALAYAEEGANLIVTSRTPVDLEILVNEIRTDFGVKAFSVAGNVAREEDVRRTVSSALNELGRIDILVNNAGVAGPVKKLEEISASEWDEVMEVNVKGYFLFAREVLPSMLGQQSGNIINISSGAGEKQQRSRPVRSIPYSVSKFAVEGFNHALAAYLVGRGINVNAIKPGPIKTALHSTTPPEILREMERKIGFQKPEVVNPLAIYLADLKPGELTGASIGVMEWNKDHPDLMK